MGHGARLAAFLAVAVLAGAAFSLPGLRDEDAGVFAPALTQAEPGPAATPIESAAPAPSASSAPQATAALAEPVPAVPTSRESIRLSYAPVVKRVAPAVVNVYATSRAEARSPFSGDPFFERFFGESGPFGSPRGIPRERARSSLGSGVIVDPQGVVVTNNHVIAEATDVKIALADGREFQAEILLRDERTDLAVLKVQNGDETFPSLPFGDSDELEVGDLVLAVGNPFGVGQTVTSGIVSAVARTNLGISDSGSFVQTDAAINPGNSGGALVDMNGAVIGINTAIFSRSGGSIGIGFAIPSNMVRVVAAMAMSGSKTVVRPWIGVRSQEVTADIAASLGLTAPSGALVVQVDPGSPGEKSGLKPGDLIQRVGGRDVGDPAGLDYRLAVAGVGKAVELEAWRDGKPLKVTVVPEGEPELDEDDLTVVGGRSPLTGAVVADLTTALADRLRIRGAETGAVIVDIEPRSPAARVGFRPGDVVVSAQGEPIRDAQQLADLAQENARIWRITLSREGRVSSIVIGG
jgi:Do/DeqQ family serine protease